MAIPSPSSCDDMLTSSGGEEARDDSDNSGETSDESDSIIEFRSTKDDAWRPVALDRIDDTLLVSFMEGTVSVDREVFKPGIFDSPDKLDHFRTRFRPLSEPVLGVDCGEVREGMTVSVMHKFSKDEWGYYNGVAEEVKRAKHGPLENGDEECRCDFLISWNHGPLVGTITPTRLDGIQTLAAGKETHQVLSDFIDKVREHFQQPWKKRLKSTVCWARRGNDGDGMASSRGQAPSSFVKFPSAWETVDLGMPEMVPRDEATRELGPPPFLSYSQGISGISAMALEFRSRRDDAWHGVNIRRTLTGKLALHYDDYTSFGEEEVHNPRDFDTLGEIEDLRERFRPLSSHLSPDECQQVKVGDRICARYTFEGTNQNKFYDAVVKEIARYQHAIIDAEELCLCSFEIFWKHGPSGGTIGSIITDSICTINPTFSTHQTLAWFLDSSRRKLSMRRAEKHHRKDEQTQCVPPGFDADADRDGKVQSVSEFSDRDKGKDIVFSD